MANQEYSLAPNFSNTASYIVVEDTAISGKFFCRVQGLGRFDPGEERVYIDGTRDDVGDGLFSWLSTWMTLDQYAYVLATILQGRRSNRVTARTRLNGLTYANYNAILTMPKTSTLSRTYGYYTDVVWQFSIQGSL